MILCSYQILVLFKIQLKQVQLYIAEMHSMLQVSDVNFLLLLNSIFPSEKVTNF